MADESGYDERVWPQIQAAIKRPSTNRQAILIGLALWLAGIWLARNA